MDVSWDELPYPFLVADEQNSVLAANRQAASELRASQSNLVGRDLAELLGQSLDDSATCPPGSAGPPVQLQSRPFTLAGKSCRIWTWQTGRKNALPPTNGDRGTILVAEDEESIREICRRVLTDSGYQVLTVANGRDAIEVLTARGTDISLVLADVVMPEAGGEAIHDYLRRSELQVPVVYTSGYAARNSPARFLDEHGVMLLRKPYSLAQLLDTVRAALEP